jgi:dinuclear metal center YbgI/SA1388 family protein
MIEREALCYYLNTLLASDGMTDFCPNGLQIEGKERIQKVATAVSANLLTIEEAVKAQVDALIVHHGIFWKGDSYVIEGIKRQKIELLIANGISLLAYHLPLDAHLEIGNNWKAAKEMGWSDLQPFGTFNGVPIGVQGTISECSQSQFQADLEKYYQHPATCALGGSKVIKTAALISGGAYKSIGEAARAKVDAFVTGNFDEPAWYQAFEEKINFFALGHSATERVGPRALAERLTEELALPCTFIDIPNPF